MDNFSQLWIIFSLSFVAALSGALSPGPLLVYTITNSVKNRKKGYLTGIAVIGGHAALELAIVFLLFFGLSYELKNSPAIRVVSVSGSLFLIYLGIALIRDVLTKKINPDFLANTGDQHAGHPGRLSAGKKISFRDNPVIGGILVSMSNPYWWIWWASIGTAFLVRYNVSLESPSKLAAFYAGHEMADLSWYTPVSMLAYFGKKKLNTKVYLMILIICGFFMAGFGAYLAYSSIRGK